ncbi:PDR/VanB family oxidoreductase [Pseudomonas sp. FP1742]|uniref:PDR/VanB family oxidoreductase n=1 Tax=Pseudomonas sp. FP1742 TaxID=2954079 RepID=UPI0027326159|nr:PDR/VanB family oxidoreductase [Pseudomonas sp. FP1742]WLG53539.1 PDR/VanB family oxidoreductase [Pseudomonas sp. FP1742]
MIEVIVTSRNNEALDICSYELASVEGHALPAFSAGAHIDVHLLGGIVRQYSLCNRPDEHQCYRIGVLKDAASRGGSKSLHEHIHVGDRLQISAPRNLFPLVPQARRSLLFAGGIGITPILSMAEHLAHEGAEFELHYCARSHQHAAFVERLKSSPFADRVHLHFDSVLDITAILANPQADQHLYTCGPGGFMQHVLDGAIAQGWAEENLHREHFSAAPVDTRADGSFSIKLGSTGQVFEVPADKTAVQVLQSHGIEVAISCEQGICGTCLTRVLEGIPDHRDLFLTEDEQAANDQFTPCCSRARSAMLVLDL